METKAQKILVLSAGAAVALSATVVVLSKDPSMTRTTDVQATVLKGMDVASKDHDRQAWLHVAGRD